MQQQRQYTFSSEPRNIPAARRQQPRYRDDTQAQTAQQGGEPTEESVAAKYGNIMYDRRIVRGNTYASQTLPATALPDPMEQQRELLRQKKDRARRRNLETNKQNAHVDPVEGRQHIEVQTDLYLEELLDKVQEEDMETQTDAFLDRPPSPVFVPAKTGVDIATQIEEGELFDFDIEVQPILEVLVGKTIEQSLLEVIEEDELNAIRAQQKKHQEIRNAETAEMQRLEEQSRRRREEKERRVKQQREVIQKENEMIEKMAARNFARNYLQDLVPGVFSSLEDSGYFYDVVEREVETEFMPWLMESVAAEQAKAVQVRTLLDHLVADVITQHSDSLKTYLQQKAAQEQAAEDANTIIIATTTDEGGAEAEAEIAADAEQVAAMPGEDADDGDAKPAEDASGDEVVTHVTAEA